MPHCTEWFLELSSTPSTPNLMGLGVRCENLGLPKWLSDKESTCHFRRHRFNPWVRKIPWRRNWQPTTVFLPEKFLGHRSLVSYTPWGCTESDMTEAGTQKASDLLRGSQVMLGS